MNEKSQTQTDLPASDAVADSAEQPRHPRIVVGVDGSDSSIAALRWGNRLASVLALDLRVVAVWQYPVMALGSYYPIEGWSPEDDTEKILSEVMATVFGDDRPSSVTTSLRSGPVAQVLIEESEGAEMLIVGSRGRGGFVGLLLGSVSATVSEHARCPVLVVHETPEGARTAGIESVDRAAGITQ